jgi:hypothetical protein
MIFVFLYIPGLNTAINSSPIPVEYFFLPIAFGLWLLFADELRKWWVRKYPKGRIAWLAWWSTILRVSEKDCQTCIVCLSCRYTFCFMSFMGCIAWRLDRWRWRFHGVV